MDPSAARGRAAKVSLVVGTSIMAGKFVAWGLTGSTAVLSDALESIVNVVAAAFALYSVRLAHAPADAEHPYGHGKIEFVSAAFEGGLIFLAGLLIFFEAGRKLWAGGTLGHLGVGTAVTAGMAVANAVLGFWLVAVGRRTDSMTLVADGKHVLSDVWTSAISVGALVLVMVTDRAWVDPALAIVAACNLIWMGSKLVREALHGILDEADPADLAAVDAVLRAQADPLLMGWGRVRSRHQGRLHHVDLTLTVPGSASVAEAHALADRVELAIAEKLGEAEIICHIEPTSS